MIPKGTVVFTGKPIAHLVSFFFLDTHCDFCIKRGNIKKCSACSFIGYCSLECQKSGWSQHKQECKNIQDFKEIVPDEIRFLARIIRKFKKEKYRDKFFQLESSIKSFKNDDNRMKQFDRVYNDLCKYIGASNVPSKDELLEIYCRVCINACTFIDIHLHFIGNAVYGFPKTLKHSCLPNATYVHYGQTIIVTTLEDLPDISWDKLRIAYVDALQPMELRQQILQDKFYFECDCTKCSTPERDILCPYKECQSGCSIMEDTCPTCKRELSDDFKDTYIETIYFTERNVDFEDELYNVKLAQLCLKKLRAIVHPTNPLLIRLLEKLHTFEESNNHWMRSLIYLEEVIAGYKHHYKHDNFAIAALYYKRAKLQLGAENSEEFGASMKIVKEICFRLFADKGYDFVTSISDELIEGMSGSVDKKKPINMR